LIISTHQNLLLKVHKLLFFSGFTKFVVAVLQAWALVLFVKPSLLFLALLDRTDIRIAEYLHHHKVIKPKTVFTNAELALGCFSLILIGNLPRC
jgi:hypothetical protein